MTRLSGTAPYTTTTASSAVGRTPCGTASRRPLGLVRSRAKELDTDQVRSSIARLLGMDVGGLVPADRDVEGVVEMMLDATTSYAQPLTADRLFGWHAALFPRAEAAFRRSPCATGATTAVGRCRLSRDRSTGRKCTAKRRSPAPNGALSASTACRRKSAASEATITRRSSARRRVRSMSHRDRDGSFSCFDIFSVLRVLADRRPSPARFLILGSASPESLRQSSESLVERLDRAEVVNVESLSVESGPTLWVWRSGIEPSLPHRRSC